MTKILVMGKIGLFTETIKSKEDDLEKASERIKLLENFMA